MGNPTRVDKEEAAFRAAHPRQKIRAAFYAMTGEMPKDVAPGDHATARRVVHKLMLARERCAPLTSQEHATISNLIKLWRDRAEGKSIRFEVMGTKRGAPDSRQKDRMIRLGWQPRPNHSAPSNPAKGTCAYCKGTFYKNRSDQIFCGRACRQTHNNNARGG